MTDGTVPAASPYISLLRRRAMSKAKTRIQAAITKIEDSFTYHEVEYTEDRGREYFDHLRNRMQCGNSGAIKFVLKTNADRLRPDRYFE